MRIFIISYHLMFSYGLESLLSEKEEFDVVGKESTFDEALARLEMLQPNVVIFYGDTATNLIQEKILRILEFDPAIKVICLNVHNNSLVLYQAAQRVIEKVDDLIDILETIPQAGQPNHSEMKKPREQV